MAAPSLADLIAEYRPGVSVRQIEREAGLPANSIGNYLKPSTVRRRIPEVDVIMAVAKALDCPPDLVTDAFGRDIGIPLPKRLSARQQRMIDVFDGLSEAQQDTLLRIAETL
jgi:transcriptional regulator with XRE-family HTH domain